MRKATGEPFEELKKGSSPTAGQHSKGIHRNHLRKLENMAPSSNEMRMSLVDMKSLRVLVERTKFNEMQVTDNLRNLKNNIRSLLKTPVNGEKLAVKRGRQSKRVMSSSASSSLVAAASSKTNLDSLFRIRRCYVRIGKDKELIRLQTNSQSSHQLRQKQQTSDGSQKRTRGRLRKKIRSRLETSYNSTSPIDTIDISSDTSSSPVTVDDSFSYSSSLSSSLKRKSTETPENSAAKRNRKQKSKGLEFFIKIGSLTRNPSPRRRLNNSVSLDEAKRKGTTKTANKPAKKTVSNTCHSTLTLRQQFGNRFFNSYVKMKRINSNGDPGPTPTPTSALTTTTMRAVSPDVVEKKKKKKNSKNLSVSFLETVEIFGESSDGEDCMEYDDFTPVHSAKGSRLKRLENCDANSTDVVKQACTSTPSPTTSTTTENQHDTTVPVESNNVAEGNVRKSGGILKRREKISFSPLKEDEYSPRKEQLKLANEKIVRLSFEEQHQDEREATDEGGCLPNASQTESNLRVPTVGSPIPEDEPRKPTTLANQQEEPGEENETSAIALKQNTEDDQNHDHADNDVDDDNNGVKEPEESTDKQDNNSHDVVENEDSQNSRHSLTEETNTSSSMPLEPETQLITPPPSAERDDSGENDYMPTVNETADEPLIENVTPVNELVNRQESLVPVDEDKEKENDESFESARGISPNVQLSIEDSEQHKAQPETSLALSDLSERLEFHESTTTENEEFAATTENDEFVATTEDDEIAPRQAESTSIEDDGPGINATDDREQHQSDHCKNESGELLTNREEISENSNQVNISNSSEQHFEDASDLVATVLLSAPNVVDDDTDHTEAVAVLDHLTQMAAVNAADNVLLNETNHLEDDVEYVNTRSNEPSIQNNVDDDFVASVVLTHPGVESTLNAVAASLVPNSQEIAVVEAVASQAAVAGVSPADVDVTDDTFASVVAEVERLSKDVNEEMYANNVGITGADVMMDNVQANNSLDDIFNDDDDDIISSLRLSSGNMDIGHDKSLPIQVIETEVMAIPNEPDLIFDKPIGTTASILGTSMSTTNDTLAGHHHYHHHHHYNHTRSETPSKLSIGRLFQSVKSYVMSPGGEKTSALQD